MVDAALTVADTTLQEDQHLQQGQDRTPDVLEPSEACLLRGPHKTHTLHLTR